MVADREQNLTESGDRVRALPRALLTMVLLALLLSVIAIVFLATNVQRQVDALAVANSDTTQWTLVQTEVEVMALQAAVHQALLSPAPDLAEIRRRYDVLFSRVRLIAESRQFADLRGTAEAAEALATLDRFLARHTTVIDAPDPELIAALPGIAGELAPLRATARSFSLLGVQFYSADSDRKRETVAATLASIGYLTLALVLALLAGIGILMSMYRRSIRSERAAAEARNRLQAVISTSLDGIIAADRTGRVIEYNGAAERIFGYGRDEAIGRDMADLIIPDPLRAAQDAGMQRYRATESREILGQGLVRMEARRRDGSVFPVELSLSAAAFDRTEIFVSVLRDISQRVGAEQELILARDRAVAGERAKTEVLAVMSHEMRTPLNGILGTIELMQDTRLTARQSRFVAAMKTSADLLLQHVNGVLGMSRADAGQLDLLADDVDPAVLVQELVESQRHAIEANGNRLRCDTAAAPERMRVDPLRLRQVILNLVGNANKFTRSGEILVECDTVAGGREVEFRVIDTGIGIAEADLDRIFEEFQVLDTSYSRQAEGTGLGLAISRRLVWAMGGEIGVESEPGEGSLFWVRLPVGAPLRLDEDQGASAVPAVQTGPAPAPMPLRVLLVEDNQINRLVAREMLHAAGHQVIEAPDGAEGLRLAGQEVFDAILMDISMPGLDGVAATRQIRDHEGPNRMIPIIALTAHALPEDGERFRAAGISDTLVKPLTSTALHRALEGTKGQAHVTLSAEVPISASFAQLTDQLGAERAASLLRSFRAEVQAFVRHAVDPAWDNEPFLRRAEAAHKLAGSAAVMGAGRLHRALQALETVYRQKDSTAASDRLAALLALWERTQADLRACLNESEPDVSCPE